MKNLVRYILFAVASFSFASAQSVQSVDILGVEVTGNNMTAASVIKYTSGLMEGKEISPGDFGRAVRKLWQTGLFSDVQIHLDRETVDGIFVTVEVEENPILGEVKIEGDKKKKKDIEEALDLTTGQRLQPYLAKESVEKIRKLYGEDGYLKAEVDVELKDGNRDNVKDIVFNVRRNRKVKTREVRFTGSNAFSDRKLRRRLKNTKVQKWYLFWRSHFEEKKFEEDKAALASFYRNRGYRDFRILSQSIEYEDDNGGMTIELKLYEGPQYYLRHLSWEGNVLYSEKELGSVLNLSKGDLYNEEEFTQAVYEGVHGLYMDRGYIYSRIEPQIRPVAEDSLDVHFVIAENHQVSVRKIEITGNTKTRENVVRREMKIVPGDIFSRDLLMRSAREIMILNYFSDVRPDVIPVDEDEIDLLVTVEERSSDEANASIGFTEEYGIMGGAGIKFNNFLGKGQQLGLSFQQGTQYNFVSSRQRSRYRSLSFNFTDPMVKDTPVLLGFSAFYYLRGQNVTYYSFPLDRTVVGASVRVGRRLKWPDNYFRASWMVQGTQKRYEGSEEDLERYVRGRETTVGLALTQFVTRDSRNHPEFPSEGSVFSWTSTLSGGPLDTRLLPVHENFHKHVLKFDAYAPLVWKFVLLNSFQMGSIKELPSPRGSIIPIDERFIMGGSGIPYGILLRGYDDNTVGPYSGQPLGGNVLLKAMLELRFPFSENPTVYALAFAEMGNVWKDFTETDPFDLKRSAGFGIRMFMPMLGMLGFDLGYGFDDIPATSKSPEGWNFHILFGMPF
ncbi:MAG: outer membrane protein assembly factor BamA [Candidatus Neomarinimicrobiota bacterium]